MWVRMVDKGKIPLPLSGVAINFLRELSTSREILNPVNSSLALYPLQSFFPQGWHLRQFPIAHIHTPLFQSSEHFKILILPNNSEDQKYRLLLSKRTKTFKNAFKLYRNFDRFRMES